jgi:S-adenosylmethionine-diacylgycerolhomoserine-N-methlytransferase
MSLANARSSNAEDMDRIYRRQHHIYDMTRKYFLLGRDHLIGELAPSVHGSVLEIGCGTGRNLIAAARRYPEARLFGLDVSSVMLSKARANIRSARLEARITLALGDAAQFDAARLFGRSRFDRVFFSYSLSMIPDWRKALSHAFETAAEPGGMVSAVDFGAQQDLPGWFRVSLHAWLARFHVTPRPDLAEVLQACAEAGGARAVFRPLYRDYAGYGAICR